MGANMNCTYCNKDLSDQIDRNFIPHTFTATVNGKLVNNLMVCISCTAKLGIAKYILPEAVNITNHILSLTDTKQVPADIIIQRKNKYSIEARVIATHNRVNAYYNVMKNAIISNNMSVSIFNKYLPYDPSFLVQVYNSVIGSMFMDTLNIPIFRLPIPKPDRRLYAILKDYTELKYLLLITQDDTSGYTSRQKIDMTNRIIDYLVVELYYPNLYKTSLIERCFAMKNARIDQIYEELNIVNWFCDYPILTSINHYNTKGA
jgi:hypothetical protein